MLIKTFGAENQNKQACEVVELGVHLRNGRGLNMSFLSVPLICEPISSQPIAFATDTYKWLASLELADYSHGDKGLEVDIQINTGSCLLVKLSTIMMDPQPFILD